MIELTKAPDADEAPHVRERCCFCRRPTHYWFEPKDVAVCRACAPHADESDVPSKKVWCRREDIAAASSRPPQPRHRHEPKPKPGSSSGRST